MLRTDIYGAVPGLTTAAETYEAAFYWGGTNKYGIIVGGLINSAANDAGNVPNYELRVGLLLGKRLTDGTWMNYNAAAVDGSEVAQGILLSAVRMQDFQGVPQQRFYGICVGGPVQAAKLLGLDRQARQQMRDHFQFDDDLPGAGWYPWKREITQIANYTALVTDNNTLFDNNGAAGPVTITLPPIQNGLNFGIKAIANQNFAFTSNEGGNIVADNNAAANTLTLSTGGHIVGAGVRVYTNPAGTKWLSDYMGAGTGNTITVS